MPAGRCASAASLGSFDTEPGRAVRCVRCHALVRTGEGPELSLYCPGSASDGCDTLDGEGLEDGGVPAVPALSRYVLVEEIGRGGMGIVYRAFDPELQRDVAVKLLCVGVVSSSRRERFLREARTAASVEDPGVVPVFDAGRTADGVAYIAMALVRGPTLESVLGDGGRLPVAEAVRLTISLARTLDRLHSRGLVHRDVKPSNVLVTPRGQPLLSDFGLALEVDEAMRLTAGGRRAGTPNYMSPELLEGRADASFPSGDVYALGLLLSELLVGERPPARVAGRLPDGSDWLARVDRVAPRDLAAICRRAAHPDPACRYPSAEALALDLERHARGEPVEAHSIPRIERVRLAARRNRSELIVAMVAVLAVLAIAAGASTVGWWREQSAGAERERLAGERLDAAWKRRSELLAARRSDEAEATFEAFVGLPEHAGTAARADALLRRARELEDTDSRAAGALFARALYAAPRGDQRVAAAAGLASALRHAGRWSDLAALLDELAADPELAPVATPELRLRVALGRLDIEEALAILPESDARRPLLEGLRTARLDTSPTPTLDAALPAPCRSPDFVSTVSAAGRLLATTGGYDRRLVQVDPETCDRRPVDPETDAFESYLHGLLPLNLDGDAADELVVAVGPPDGYGLRVLRLGPVAAPLVELWTLGYVTWAVPIDPLGAAPALAVAVTPRHPSRLVFPTGDPGGAAPGVYLVRWASGTFDVARFEAAPKDVGGPMAPRWLEAVDLDGDADQDLVASFENREGFVMLRDGDAFTTVPLGGVQLDGVAHGEGGPRLRVEDGAQRWILGEGDRPSASLVSREERPSVALRGDDPGWDVGARLVHLGLAEAGAEEFTRLGRARAGADSAAAWSEAAALWESLDQPRQAAEAWLEAGRAGEADAWARAVAGFDIVLDDERAAATAREAPEGAAPARDAGAVVMDFTSAPGPEWAFRGPLARWNPGGWLDVEASVGTGPVARLDLVRTSGPIGVRARLGIDWQEWAHGVRLRLASEDGRSAVPLFLQTGGGGGFMRREVGVGVSLASVDDLDPAGPHRLDVAFAEVAGERRALIDVSWDGAPPTVAWMAFPAIADTPAWSLEIAPLDQGFDGPYGRVSLHELRLRGLAPSGRPASLAPPTPDQARSMEVSALRADPEGASDELVRERGLPAALDLVERAWTSALSMHRADRRIGEDLVHRLPLLDAREAAELAPGLVANRGIAILRAGFLDRAAAELARALPHVDDRGDACLVTHTGLAAVARARGEDPAAERARAVACAPNEVLGERRVRRLEGELR